MVPPRILALKGRTQDAIDEIEAYLQGFGDDVGRFELLAIREAGNTLLRLNHVDAVIVTRDDFDDAPKELAEVFAWIRAIRQRQGVPVPIGVHPCQKQRNDCDISTLSKIQGSCKDGLKACVDRVIRLCDQVQAKKRDGRRRRYADVAALTEAFALPLADTFAMAVEAGWTTPDGKISRDSLEATPQAVLWEWIHERPALAWASAADALGWLAYEAANATTSVGQFADVRLPSDAEHVINCALARALEKAKTAPDPHRVMAACSHRRVAIVWSGDDSHKFRLALRGLLFGERLGSDAAAPSARAGAWQKDGLEFRDLTHGDGTTSTAPLAADDLERIFPVPAVIREEIATKFSEEGDLVVLSVAEKDLDAVDAAARKFNRDCIVLNESDLGELLEDIFAAASRFTDRIGHA